MAPYIFRMLGAGVKAAEASRTWDLGTELPVANPSINCQIVKGEIMNKSELIVAVAMEAGVSKGAAGNVLDAVVGAVTKAVAKGDSVALIGFGTFKPSKRAARVGRNPQTGKELKIAATTVPKFTAGAGFKAAVAGKKAAKKKYCHLLPKIQPALARVFFAQNHEQVQYSVTLAAASRRRGLKNHCLNSGMIDRDHNGPSAGFPRWLPARKQAPRPKQRFSP